MTIKIYSSSSRTKSSNICFDIHSQVWLFAGDTAVCITINGHSGSDALRRGLGTLRTWERLWGMDFGPSGCRVLHISRSGHPAQHICMLHGRVLGAMDHAKCLGVDIGGDLGWGAHIDRISTNANGALGFLKRNIKTKNTAVRAAACQTLVRPRVEYASTVWSPFAQAYIGGIEVVQRGAVRWVGGNCSTCASVGGVLGSLGGRRSRCSTNPFLQNSI